MNKNNTIELTETEIKNILEKFISCFKEDKNKDGRKFEIFLGKFLPNFGFDEVCVTQYSRDGGIDLTALRKGFDIKGTDNQNYYIQAKCYALSNVVGSKEIDALRGSTKRDKNGNILTTNYINVFITTSTFSSNAIKSAEENIHNPVILIDGITLIDMCIQKGIGFDFKPVFDQEEIKDLIDDKMKNAFDFDNKNLTLETLVEKNISRNDVRARILPLPQMVRNALKNGQTRLSLSINGGHARDFNIDKTQRYLGGVTEIYKQLGMIKNDGVLESRNSKWYTKDDLLMIDIETQMTARD